MQSTVIQRVTEFFNLNAPLKSGTKLIAALSGGMDSVVMLHCLLMLQKDKPFTLLAAHLNHQLRGDESDRDESFVQDLCKDWQVKLYTSRQDVNAYCKSHNCSIETGARECRYSFFENIHTDLQADYIATAHHADDNAETVLDRLLRGSGTTGLAGIPPKRDFYIRPLLQISRKEIESYAAEHHLTYRTDSTNADTRYKRNRIRHVLLPMLQQEFNPQIAESINRFSSIMRETDELVKKESQIAFSQCVREASKDKIILDISDFLAYLVILQKGMIRVALDKLDEPNGISDFDQFENLITFIRKNKSGTKFRISSTTGILISSNELVIGHEPEQHESVTIHAAPGKYPFWNGQILEIKEAIKPLEFQNKTNTQEWIDADKLLEPLVIRTVKDGDRFTPVNFQGSKKVSDFFIDLKIPVYQRNQVPLLESRSKIVWIAGYRLDDRFKVTNNTKRILKLEVK